MFYEENRGLVIRRAGVGSLLALIGTAGYYGAYVVILYRTLHSSLGRGPDFFWRVVSRKPQSYRRCAV